MKLLWDLCDRKWPRPDAMASAKQCCIGEIPFVEALKT